MLWIGYDTHIWPLRTIMMVAIGLVGRSAQGLFLQECAVTTNKLRVAIIEKGVDLNTNAVYVGRSVMEPCIVKKGGREIALPSEGIPLNAAEQHEIIFS